LKSTEFSVKTRKRIEVVDITGKVDAYVRENGLKDGVLTVYVPHTTAGITINENADPSVKSDFLNTINQLIPANAGYSHMEGNADSHIKTILTNPSQTFIVEDSRLVLGTWQGIYFCEYDGPRSRRVWLKFIEG